MFPLNRVTISWNASFETFWVLWLAPSLPTCAAQQGSFCGHVLLQPSLHPSSSWLVPQHALQLGSWHTPFEHLRGSCEVCSWSAQTVWVILHTKLWSSLSQNAWTSYFGLEVTATSIQNVRKLTYKLDELGSSFGVGVRNVEVNSDSLRIRFFESANTWQRYEWLFVLAEAMLFDVGGVTHSVGACSGKQVMIKLLKASPASRITSPTLPSRRRSVNSLDSDETAKLSGRRLLWETFVNFFYVGKVWWSNQLSKGMWRERVNCEITYQVKTVGTKILGHLLRENSKNEVLASGFVQCHSNCLKGRVNKSEACLLW
jgi:hypothetical protein